MEEVEITIIGAGIAGLAIAAELSTDRKVYILEKNEAFGQETSSRNSEVIHAGIYYPPDSLKARLCVEGNALVYEICQEYEIGCQKVGKLIVASNDKEIEELEKLLRNGKNNGINLRFLSKREVKALEPNVSALCAILSPATGIVDSHGLMKHFVNRIKYNGSEIVYGTKVTGIEKLSTRYKVTVEDSSGISSFLTGILINSAGLYSDRIAELAGINIAEAGYKLHYCKGEYFSLSKRLTQRLIYPVPEPKNTGLGIHITPDLQGRVRLGPNATYVNNIDYKVDEKQKQNFFESVKIILPLIQYDDMEPEFAGIRPKLQGPGEGFRDFVIMHEQDRGLEGFINLIGIESPGLTASPAIAKYVAGMVR